jgi:hypothetical protein
VIAGIAAIFLVAALVKRKLPAFGKEFLFLVLLGILTFVSAFASEYPDYSMFGIMEQYESVWVLIGYLILGCYCYVYVKQTKDPACILRALAIGVFLSCLIGLMQLLAVDFWGTDIGKKLLIPDAYAQLRDSLSFNISSEDQGKVYLAMYNPNYAGIYLLMVCPLLLLSGKKRYLCLAAAVILCLIGTGSRTVWLAAVVLGLLLCAAGSTGSKTRTGRIVLSLLLLTVLAGGVWYGFSGLSVEETASLEEVEPQEDAVRIVYQGTEVYLGATNTEDGGVKQEVYHADGSRVEMDWADERGEGDPFESALQGIHFRAYGKDGISYAVFRYQDLNFRFTKDLGTGKYEYISINGKPDELVTADTFSNLPDRFLNGRGYIWKRVLPLIFGHALLGTGPDTFLLVFPQNDYVARANLGYEFFTQLLTNAHSLYLQMALQTGIPSLLCFLAFVGIYLRKSWKLYAGKLSLRSEKGQNEKEQKLQRVGAALALGVSGYLLCGLTWASSVGTTPIFWMLLGCGMAVNELGD